MKFKIWADKSGKSEKELAKIIKVSISSIRKYRAGERIPRPKKLIAIQKLTDHKVTLGDWI